MRCKGMYFLAKWHIRTAMRGQPIASIAIAAYSRSGFGRKGSIFCKPKTHNRFQFITSWETKHIFLRPDFARLYPFLLSMVHIELISGGRVMPCDPYIDWTLNLLAAGRHVAISDDITHLYRALTSYPHPGSQRPTPEMPAVSSWDAKCNAREGRP